MTQNWRVSDLTAPAPQSKFSLPPHTICHTHHLPPQPCTSIYSEVHVHVMWTLSKQEVSFSVYARISFIWVEEIRVWGQGVSQMISETVHPSPATAFHLRSAMASDICTDEGFLCCYWPGNQALQTLAAHHSGMSAAGLQVISTVSRQLCRSETPWVAPLHSSQHAARPHSLSALRLMATQTLSLLFFHHQVEFFHFSLLVLILSPCFILSGLS